ncbi:hypothetical protein DM02DRAFT_420959 [Periconia macrospinosa]|uniref:Malate dehydrogenase n=1 Tax=Periconia macrospinosa TaxID=97972 RepID=A0A2V1CY16_9PLEO|nr:hypothetical protein DM02DRAFT_420959 [Periconia macrospinosa]
MRFSQFCSLALCPRFLCAVPIGLGSLAAKYPPNALPSPEGLHLKFVVLGVGTQNYTCVGGDDASEPGTIGAVAQLYDIGTRLNTDPHAQSKISSLSGRALVSASKHRLEGYLESEGYDRRLGSHFFSPTGPNTSLPTFFLDRVPSTPFPIAIASKKNATDAPRTAFPGLAGEGAVQWLRLVDDDGMSVGGIDTVYRIETAGDSKPASCKGRKGDFEVPYAAQYWMYGGAT